MVRSLMAIYVFVALALPGFIHGRPAIDSSGSILSMLESRVSKGDVWEEQKAISPFVQEGPSIPPKIRQKRISDQRLAELEARMTLSKITEKRSLGTRGNIVDLKRIGRRRRFAAEQIPAELISVHRNDMSSEYNGGPECPSTGCINR